MRALAAAVVLVAACGDDAAHVSLPRVIAHGGPVLGELDLVTITFPNDPLADVAERFDAAVPRSRWLVETGEEYGVRGGAQLAAYRMPADAPAHMTYAQVEALPAQLLAQGAVPGPNHHGAPILYDIYLPAATTVTDDDGGNPMCIGVLAYHTWSGTGIPMTVVPTCYDSALARTTSMSHEIIEAATDPFGTGYFADPPDETDPLHYYRPEVADLCPRGTAYEDGFGYETSWSNAEADAWRARPCVPIAADDEYRMVFVTPGVADAAPGESVTFDLRGWASGPTDPWPLYARHGFAGSSSALNDALAETARFSAPTINTDEHVTLTLTVPADAAPGQIVAANVWSHTTWNLIVIRVHGA